MSGQAKAPVKLSSVVNASRYVPSTSTSSLIVGVRVRPLLPRESRATRRDIIRVLDNRVVVVLDPDEVKRCELGADFRDMRRAVPSTAPPSSNLQASNEDVYSGTVRDLVSGVLYGVNTTVFAYGSTGSGKTYTMVGSAGDPGLMVLSLQRIFQDRDRLFKDEELEVICTYLEVYNETIFDLLVKSSGPLELREDPEQGVQVAGLRQINVSSAEDIMDLLDEGNRRRKTESTDANAQSSRSHAVLEISIKRSPRNHYRVQQLRAKLSLVDLAGSERAAETNNAGQKLRDGANINRSLLALANCINALGKVGSTAGKAGAAYVPYRNSKLTRLLKDGLSGNSRTCMIATISAASDQYHHSISTLKYADRAKEIKTMVIQNVGTVESHIADYQRIIDNLQTEVQDLKVQLSERVVMTGLPSPNSAGRLNMGAAEDELLSCIDGLVQDMNENIEERINLQKALFEIEDANLFNRYENKQLEEFLEAGQGGVKDVAEARDRRADILAAIKDNERELSKFKAEIASNEEARRDIQARIDRLITNNHNVAFLNLMSTFRLQAVRLEELKFQMAVRDQVIGEQREVISNLWRIIDKSGLGKQRVIDIARSEGIIMDGLLMPLQEPRHTLSREAPLNNPASALALNDANPYGGQQRPERDLPAAVRRRGAGIRVEHISHLHSAPPGQAGRGPRRNGLAGAMLGGAGCMSVDRGEAGRAALVGAVQAAVAVAAGGSNATMPGTIRSGRRAGLPARSSLSGEVEPVLSNTLSASSNLEDAHEVAQRLDLGLPAPRNGFTGYAANGGTQAASQPHAGIQSARVHHQMKHQHSFVDESRQGNGHAGQGEEKREERRAVRGQHNSVARAAGGQQAWGEMGGAAPRAAGGGSNATSINSNMAAGVPPAPPPMQPIVERLARLKGRMSRKADDAGSGPTSISGPQAVAESYSPGIFGSPGKDPSAWRTQNAGANASQDASGFLEPRLPLSSSPGAGAVSFEAQAAAVQATLAVAGAGLLHARPNSRTLAAGQAGPEPTQPPPLPPQPPALPQQPAVKTHRSSVSEVTGSPPGAGPVGPRGMHRTSMPCLPDALEKHAQLQGKLAVLGSPS
ncbi:P-loop containing nucleoside triphosphate hydrolase protein [Haematococcus lacustris]